MDTLKKGDKVFLDPKVYGEFDIQDNVGTIVAVVDQDEEYGYLFEIQFERPLSEGYTSALVYECEVMRI